MTCLCDTTELKQRSLWQSNYNFYDPKIEWNKILSQSDMYSERQKKKESKAKSTYSSTHVGRNILSSYATGGKNHVRDSKALIAVA